MVCNSSPGSGIYTVTYADSVTHQPRYIKVFQPFRMPVQAPSWTEFLICPICTNEFAANLRAPITLRCGHSICKKCLATIQQCPYDQSQITKELDSLPINYALLQLVTQPGDSINNADLQEILPSIVQSLTADELQDYKQAKSCIEELALYLKPNGSIAGLFSRPMQRKLVTLINCQLVEDEGRARSMRAARSLGERTVTELILQHQNPQQLSANLWAAVRARGCQFLGPAMQEEVLKLVLLALEDGVSLCRKVLVMFVVQRLESTFPQASKTSIGHVVQLLYRASCFKVSKRDGDSSLMQLKEEYRTYKSLRKEHDAQIVQIATEAGLRIAPDQWSALLYGDPNHKSDMQSLIDKQQSPQSFGQSVQELMIALQRTGDPANLSALRGQLMKLADIDASSESNIAPDWKECAVAIEAVKRVVNGLVEFVQNHGNRKNQDSSHLSHATRYKISFCRDLSIRGNCPRGQNCTFAHSDEELERYRSKMKNKSGLRQTPGPPTTPKVNISHPGNNGNNNNNYKPMPYRSENSLNHTPAKSGQLLMPANYVSPSSSSTPNLSQSQLSPKVMSGNGQRWNYSENSPPGGYHRPPPFSAPPVSSQNYVKTSPGYSSKQFSPYHNNQQVPPRHFPQVPMMRGDDYSNNNNGDSSKYQQMSWRKTPSMKTSPHHLSPMSPPHTSPSEMSRMMNYNRDNQKIVDEVDGFPMWMPQQQQQPVFQFDTAQAKDGFIRSDSILTSNVGDDDFSFDSLSITGKYGAIGIKTPNSGNSRQWSGLQSSMGQKQSFNGAGGDSMKIGNYNARMNLPPQQSPINGNNINNNRPQKGGNNFINMSMGVGDMNTGLQQSRAPFNPQQYQQLDNNSSFWNEPMKTWKDESLLKPGDFDLPDDTLNGMWKFMSNE